MITLKEISKKYGFSEGHFRTLLCRPEFNQFRIDKFFIFDNSGNFHKMLKYIIKLVLFALLLNIQPAWCQHYEPVIIYSPSGEPQTMLKGKIIYDNYGIPKSYIPTKGSVRSVR